MCLAVWTDKRETFSTGNLFHEVNLEIISAFILNIYSYHHQEPLNFRALTLGKCHSLPVMTHLSPTDANNELCSQAQSSPALFRDITQHYLIAKLQSGVMKGPGTYELCIIFFFLELEIKPSFKQLMHHANNISKIIIRAIKLTMGSIKALSAQQARMSLISLIWSLQLHTQVQEFYLGSHLRLWSLPDPCWRSAGLQLRQNCAWSWSPLIQTSVCRAFSWLAPGPAFSAMELQHDHGPLLLWDPLGVLLAFPEGVALPLLLPDKKVIGWDYTVLKKWISCNYSLIV